MCVAAGNVAMPRRPATAMDHIIKENFVQPAVIRPKLQPAAGASDQVGYATHSRWQLLSNWTKTKSPQYITPGCIHVMLTDHHVVPPEFCESSVKRWTALVLKFQNAIEPYKF